ncbi:MAG TPA: hypothetical protein VH306_02240 [Gaiellaceae bacterium]
MQAIILLLDPQTNEISDYHTVTPPEGLSVIVFSDEAKLKEVLHAVTPWAAEDGLVAGSVELEAETLDEAVQVVLLMSPHMSQVRFIPDTDPFVDTLLANIRGEGG